MDIQRAFTFFRDDEAWIKKVGIGIVMILLSWLILPAFMLGGYGVSVGRKVMNGKDIPLPEWNFGQNLKDGFAVFAAGFVYMLPALLLMIVGGVLGGGLASIGDGDIGAFLGGGVGIIFFLLAFVWLLAMGLVSPALYVQYIREGTFGSMLNFSAVTDIVRGQLKNILMIFGVMIVVSLVLGVVGAIPCAGQIAALAAAPVLTIAGGHMYGQIAQMMGGKTAKMAEF